MVLRELLGLPRCTFASICRFHLPPGAPRAAPWMAKVLPAVAEIAKRHAPRTVFTRFVPPQKAAELGGTWRKFYAKWHKLTRAEIDLELLELVPELRAHVPPAAVVDKPFYSPLRGARWTAFLHKEAPTRWSLQGPKAMSACRHRSWRR